MEMCHNQSLKLFQPVRKFEKNQRKSSGNSNALSSFIIISLFSMLFPLEGGCTGIFEWNQAENFTLNFSILLTGTESFVNAKL